LPTSLPEAINPAVTTITDNPGSGERVGDRIYPDHRGGTQIGAGAAAGPQFGYRVHAHLMFVTKHRRPAFTDLLLTDCQHLMPGICTEAGAQLREFNGESDHVHLLGFVAPWASSGGGDSLLCMALGRQIPARRLVERLQASQMATLTATIGRLGSRANHRPERNAPSRRSVARIKARLKAKTLVRQSRSARISTTDQPTAIAP
jgi:hypothetical protein